MKEHKTQICRILYAIALFVVIMGVVSFINSTLEMYDYYFMPEKENKDCFYQFRKIVTVFSIVFAVFSAVYIIAFFARKAETKLVCSIWFWLKTVCMLGAVACVIIFEICFKDVLGPYLEFKEYYECGSLLWVTKEEGLSALFTMYSTVRSGILEICVCLAIMWLVDYIPQFAGKSRAKKEESNP